MNAWDRQEGEPIKLFERFETYRRLGPQRTVDDAFRQIQGHKGIDKHAPGRWRLHFEQWRWKERAEAWDAYQFDLARKDEQNAINDRRKAWIQQAMALQSIGVQSLAKIQETLSDPENTSPLSPREALLFIEAGARLEMLSRGEATEINKTEHSGKIDWVQLWTPKKNSKGQSVEDKIAALERLAEKKQETQDE